MIPVSLEWICEQVQGQLVQAAVGSVSPSAVLQGEVVIDSRNLQAGDLFIAIQGPNFDGHNFCNEVAQQGAFACIVERDLGLAVPQIIVSDSRLALGALGAAVKAEVQPKSVAITGSSGKTTVKEMVAAILRHAPSVDGDVLATLGNFNNDIGVPLTLLRLTHAHRYGVFELGANHRGEIAYTTGLVRPDVAMINNVAPAHVEGFGDICGVAKAKTEIFRGLGEQGIALTNADSEFHDYWQRELAGQHWQTFGLGTERPADYQAHDIELNEDGCAQCRVTTPDGEYSLTLPVPGRHNVANALAAIALCRGLGLPMAEILSGFQHMQSVPGRMLQHTPWSHVRLIDDTYNANVGSAKAAIDVLASLPGRRIFVLGDMGELGTQARAYHEEVGAHGIQAGIDGFYTLGVLSQSASEIFNGHGGRHFDSVESLVAGLQDEIASGEALTILVKGSRSARMERIVNALLTAAQEEQKQQRGNAAC